MKLRYLYIIVVFLLFSILSFFFFSNLSVINAQGKPPGGRPPGRMTPAGVIEGSVRVNICGDSIADGPEHCDGRDLRGQTCRTLGFTGGVLRCNLVCEFDTSRCVSSPREEGDDLETDQTGSIDMRERGRRNEALEEFLRRNVPQAILQPRSETQLPSAIQFLKLFDANDDGIIQSSELPLVVLNWVNAWKYDYEIKEGSGVSCDLNNDGVCDLRDFSILMFYLDLDLID